MARIHFLNQFNPTGLSSSLAINGVSTTMMVSGGNPQQGLDDLRVMGMNYASHSISGLSEFWWLFIEYWVETNCTRDVFCSKGQWNTVDLHFLDGQHTRDDFARFIQLPPITSVYRLSLPDTSTSRDAYDWIRENIKNPYRLYTNGPSVWVYMVDDKDSVHFTLRWSDYLI